MVVGFDFSTTRIDWAWVAPTGPCHSFQSLGKPSAPIVERVRAVVGLGLPYDMTYAAIEYPFSKFGNSASLMAVLGALTTRIDRSAEVAWVSSGDLRAAIGAANKKADAAAAIRDLYGPLESWDEHALDALVACVGWTNILNLQENPSA